MINIEKQRGQEERRKMVEREGNREAGKKEERERHKKMLKK